MMKSNLMYGIVILTLLISCGKSDTITENPDVFPIDPVTGPVDSLASAISDFGFCLFADLAKTDTGNLVISPLSIHTALLMAYDGSRNNTQDQMREVLGLGQLRPDDVNPLAPILKDAITSTDPTASLSYSNTIFNDPRIIVDQDFKNNMATYFDADIKERSFDDQATVTEINNWAEENTEGRIKEVIKEIDVDEVMFLINALYFIGDWEKGFERRATTDRDFQLTDGNTISVPTMSSDGERSYYIGPDKIVLDLPVKGNEYSVSFIASQSMEIPINNMISTATFLDDYKEIISDKLITDRVYTLLPKFELEGKLKLNDILIEKGMSDAFDGSISDLTGLGSGPQLGNLFISRVLHDTYIKVDEQGIEGAAVTVVAVADESLPPTLDFGRPFVFVLRHNGTGIPIFIGKVENPIE